MMIGAKDFYHENEGRTLSFRFKSCNKANLVKITLNGLDLYDVEFVKVGRLNRTTLSVPRKTTGSFSHIYGDQLVRVFEDFTGLFLSL